MNLLDLIFTLVWKFVPMKQDDWAKMKEEAEADVREWHPEHKNKFKAMYAKYNGRWYFRLALAVSYIPLVRGINNWINGSGNEEKEEKED